MNGIRFVNIGGGSASFKTHVADALAIDYPGQILVVNEVATALLEKLVPRPGVHIPYSTDWQRGFQEIVIGVQRPLEKMWEMVAEHHKIGLIVTDRTWLDGASFWPGGQLPFCDTFGLKVEDALNHVAIHFHLQSMAVWDPEAYESNRTMGNATRFEPLEHSQQLCRSAWHAWDGHPRRVFVPGHQKAWKRIEMVEEFIDLLLTHNDRGLDRLVTHHCQPPGEYHEKYKPTNVVVISTTPE